MRRILLLSTLLVAVTFSAWAEDKQATATTNVLLGRQPVAIVDGQYPASYFPNTELLGPDEMRITALGTGMPNLTRSSASICYLVEFGQRGQIPF